MNIEPTAIEDARRRHDQFRRALTDALLHLSPGLLAFDRRQQDSVIGAVRTFEAFDDDLDDDHAIGDLELPLAYDGRVHRELIFFRIHRISRAPRATASRDDCCCACWRSPLCVWHEATTS